MPCLLLTKTRTTDLFHSEPDSITDDPPVMFGVARPRSDTFFPEGFLRTFAPLQLSGSLLGAERSADFHRTFLSFLRNLNTLHIGVGWFLDLFLIFQGNRKAVLVYHGFPSHFIDQLEAGQTCSTGYQLLRIFIKHYFPLERASTPASCLISRIWRRTILLSREE